MRSLFLRAFPALTAALIVSGCALFEPAAEPVVAQKDSPAGAGAKATDGPLDPRRDYHSYANTTAFVTEHLVLDLTVDFERYVLDGTVELQLRRLSPAAKKLVLDTRDVQVRGAEAATGDGPWTATRFKLGDRDAVLGSPLTITMPEGADRVRISYTTAPDASGLQWLTPAQTAGKQHPFLFTQSQAIHARSWIPCQDTPQVRSTYEARIRTPKELFAVMSAANDLEAKRDGDYSFRMPQPVPSYLLALAVGDVDFKPIGKRSGIFAEPSMLDASVKEFEDTEKMMDIVERMYGPYRWDRYDSIVLPPAFPYGGMENPRISFLTPTVVTGDKSGVSLVAHELAHSWSGNLVTNATWRDFWLNEGTTTYLTYRIMDELFGQARGDMERLISFRNWLSSNENVSNPGDRALAYDVRGRDPDEVFSSIPYVRGQNFFRFLEHKFGRKDFDAFLRGWFDANAFKSRTTEEFIAYLEANLMAAHPGVVTRDEIDDWIFGSDMPAGIVEVTSDAFARVDAQRTAWLSGKTPVGALKTKGWTRHEWEHFLDQLPEDTTTEQIEALDRQFNLSRHPNPEVLTSWFSQAIRHGYAPALPYVDTFLLSVGRMKFLNPLYRELAKTPEGLERARKLYAAAKPGYHPIAQAGLERILAEPES